MKIKTPGLRQQTAGLICEDESLTQQQFKDECDIDCILRKYDQTGCLVDPLSERRAAQFGDFSDIPDFQSAQNRIAEAGEYFDSLPPQIRAVFANDLSVFVEALGDPQNESKLIELGILEKNASETLTTTSDVVGKVDPLPVNLDALETTNNPVPEDSKDNA